MKVYLDEDLSPTVALLLRQRGVDATSAHDVGNSQLGDRAQLRYATREGRAIVTKNVADFLRLAHDAVATNTAHAGIVLVPSSFRGNEYDAIAEAIVEELKPCAEGLDGVVLYVRHGQSKSSWSSTGVGDSIQKSACASPGPGSIRSGRPRTQRG